MKKRDYKILLRKSEMTDKEVAEMLDEHDALFIKKKAAWEGLSDELKLLIDEPMRDCISKEDFMALQDDED